MARFFSQADVKPGYLKQKTIAVVGYGNQGHAHALNLRDSGMQVIIGARKGKGADQALKDGFEVLSISDAVDGADVAMLTLPDVAMKDIWVQSIAPALTDQKVVLFAHGFNIVYRLIELPMWLSVGVIAPKGAGAKLRSEYVAGRGLACLIAVDQDPTDTCLDTCLAYAEGIGGFRSLVMETTPREETHTDLFGEQTVLCGGIPELLKAAFETLVEAGYSPETAYFECIHEAKLITDLIYARGLAGMRQAISDTAEWGGFEVGPQVIAGQAREAMAASLARIQNFEFANDWMKECAEGQPRMKSLEKEEASLLAEEVGNDLRGKMEISINQDE